MRGCCTLLIDDHALFRSGLSLLLASHPSLGELLEAGSIAEARQLNRPDIGLILLDVCLPGLNGLDGIGLLRQCFPQAAVLVLSGSDDAAHLPEALRKGADGFLSKAASADQIAEAIDALLNGAGAWNYVTLQTGATPAVSMTNRQLEVLCLMCEGKSNKAIARALAVAENTVRVHVSAILAALGVSSRTEAVIAARDQGIMR